MLFGRSLFDSILTRLDHEQPEEPTTAPEPAFRVNGLPAGFVATVEVAESEHRAGDAYRAFQADAVPDFDDDERRLPAGPAFDPMEPTERPEAEDAGMPARFERLTEAQVIEDLGLSPTDDAEVLAEKRRRFARDNHPDRVHPQLRDRATIRMTLANAAVDRAMRGGHASAFFDSPGRKSS